MNDLLWISVANESEWPATGRPVRGRYRDGREIICRVVGDEWVEHTTRYTIVAPDEYRALTKKETP